MQVSNFSTLVICGMWNDQIGQNHVIVPRAQDHKFPSVGQDRVGE